MSSSEDDLQQAIALSLQSCSSNVSLSCGARDESIDRLSDTEGEDVDDDIRQAIALSLLETRKSDRTDSSSAHGAVTNHGQQTDEPIAIPMPSSSIGGIQTGLGGMDRRAMEQERLARLGKRKRDAIPEQPLKRTTNTPSIKNLQYDSQATALPTGCLQYPQGVIKRTFAEKYPRSNDITIDELLQAPHIHTAVISSFQWEAEWLQEKLNPIKIKQVWIMNAKPKDVQERWIREMKDCEVPNLKLHFPPMDGMIQNMHSKFLLLFAKEKLRFVVTTANMIRTDWGEVANDWQPGVMENSVFIIDLPRLEGDVPSDAAKLTKFGQELVYFLERQKVGRNVIDGVLKFNFAQTEHLAFVHSIGGADYSTAHHPTGLPGLARAVRDLGLDGTESIEIDYATSSLGAVNDSFLQRIHLAARGIDFDAQTQLHNVRKDFCIYFPTKDTVEKSTGGPDCAGMVAFASSYYQAPTFPKECLRDYDSNRRGMLSHNKLLFARGRKDNGKPVAWVYVGSANMSESAWGGQRVLKSGKLGSVNIRNWECGVIMPVPEDALSRSPASSGRVPPMSVFARTVEVPFHWPGTEYGQRQPWLYRRT